MIMLRLLVAALGAISAVSAPVATPNFEVKLSLLPSALTSNTPSSALISALSLSSTSKEETYAYYDTDDLSLNAQGWAVRLRHKEGKDLQLTYKKRYPVSDSLSSTLSQAQAEGFDSSDTNYEAQVDWSYRRQVLSFANTKKESSTAYSGTSLPDASTGLQLLVDRIPGKLKDWKSSGWGKETLKSSREHGPVTSKTWDGSWNGVDVSVEVLPVRTADGKGTELYTEFSFKVDDEATAGRLRDKAIAQFEAEGWLDKDGDLKTTLVLDRY